MRNVISSHLKLVARLRCDRAWLVCAHRRDQAHASLKLSSLPRRVVCGLRQRLCFAHPPGASRLSVPLVSSRHGLASLVRDWSRSSRAPGSFPSSLPGDQSPSYRRRESAIAGVGSRNGSSQQRWQRRRRCGKCCEKAAAHLQRPRETVRADNRSPITGVE